MTVAVDLVDVLVAALEQAGPEQRARLRAALELEPDIEQRHDRVTQAVFTPQTLARELGRTPRAIRGAIARGELDAVKRGRGWVIGADAVERWAAGARAARPRARESRGSRRRAPGPGPMARALRT